MKPIQSYTYQHLPSNSPFLNIVEPVNREHKHLIRKKFRDEVDTILELHMTPWGQKMEKKLNWILDTAHKTWQQVQNKNISLYWEHIKQEYFPLCKNHIPIHY